MIARDTTSKLTAGIHQIVIFESQFKDSRLDNDTCNVNSDMINYGECVNSLSGRFIYQLLKPKRV